MTVSSAHPDFEEGAVEAYWRPPLMRSGREALYRQIADRLRRLIAAGATRLPTERRLARDFSVARITVRQALDLLANDQLISRQRRFGTLVVASEGRLAPTTTRRPKRQGLGDGIDPH